MPTAAEVLESLHSKIQVFAEKSAGEDVTADQARNYAGAAKELAEAAAWIKKPDQQH